jgi:hypothetical protein
MPRKNTKEPAVEEAVVAEEIVVEEPAVEDTGSVVVLRADGEVMRTYTKTEHGAEYRALAKGYAEKKGYSLR